MPQEPSPALVGHDGCCHKRSCITSVNDVQDGRLADYQKETQGQRQLEKTWSQSQFMSIWQSENHHLLLQCLSETETYWWKVLGEYNLHRNREICAWNPDKTLKTIKLLISVTVSAATVSAMEIQIQLLYAAC